MTAPDPAERVSAPETGVAYPPAPWDMVGQQWMSLFRVKERVDDLRPAGVYAVAFVSYEEPSPLTYHELLVARPIDSTEHGRRVSITDIWVDSPASVAGGRELWAIPKGLCDFTLRDQPPRPAVLDRLVGERRAALDRHRVVPGRVPRRAPAAVQGRHLAARHRGHRR